MKTRLRNILLTLLLFAMLAVPAAAGTFTYNVSLPTGAFALQERQMAELSAFAGLDVSLIAVDTIDVPARERAQEMWDDAGTALWGTGAEVSDAAVVIVYDVAHNDAGVARSEGAEALLTDADVDAIEAAFAAPDSDDPYVHVINGLKKLEICALDGGDVPAYSYAAQFLRDPDSVPDAAPGPDSRIIVATDDRNDAADASCTYLADEIGRWSGVSVDVMIGSASPADDALALRTAAYEVDPDTTVALVCDPVTGEAAASIGDAAAAELPADAADQLCTALRATDGDAYARTTAALETLAKILFADGSREYDPNSGIALALDPDAFAETVPAVPAVWITVAALAAFALAAVAVVLCLKKNRSH